MSFVHEAWVYRLLQAAGIRVPRHQLVVEDSSLGPWQFKPGEAVVLKGVADEVWHKSDLGLLQFASFAPATLLRTIQKFRKQLEPEQTWRGLLICKQIAFLQSPGLPSEAFLSLRRDRACGWVAAMGCGGVHTEQWARSLEAGILQWPLALLRPELALKELEQHLLGRVWLGRLRQGRPLTNSAQLIRFLQALWRLPALLESEGIDLIELNPLVVDADGVPTALDGVGQQGDAPAEPRIAPTVEAKPLLQPGSIAIAGISKRTDSFGRLILTNLLKSSLPKERLRVIKPGIDSLDGVPCLPDVGPLADDPVDLLIVALPAEATLQLLDQLCEQGAGAQFVYLVAGGIGDGADRQQLGQQLRDRLNELRRDGRWTPALIGPNGLGIVSADVELNTLFIPRDKLRIAAQRQSPLALVSQSGAFFITRVSRGAIGGVRYALCTGNQLDVKFPELMRMFREQTEIEVLGLYAEGFAGGEVLEIAREAQHWRESGRSVILYRGGRSVNGMAAAASHTGAMVSDSDLDRRTFEYGGVTVCERFSTFEAALAWRRAYPQLTPRRIAMMSNAGYEAVSAADHLTGRLEPARLSEELRGKLQQRLVEQNLSGLVSPALPLDVTPMANEEAYLACIEALVECDADALLVGIVPLTRRLDSSTPGAVESFAAAIASLSHQLPIGVVIDSGPQYDAYRDAFRRAGLPTFESIESAFDGLVVLAPRAGGLLSKD